MLYREIEKDVALILMSLILQRRSNTDHVYRFLVVYIKKDSFSHEESL